MTGPLQVLQIEPAEYLRFAGPFSEIVTSELSIQNPTDGPVAFKVKTTAPRRYAVRPNSGVLQAGEYIAVSVMRQPFEYDPNEKMKHKFMIQSIRVLPGQDVTSIWQDTDPSQMMDTRMKVVFDDNSPSNRSSITEEEFHKVQEENHRLSKEVEMLKEERQRLRSMALGNSKHANVDMPKGISLIFHEKKNVVVVIILLVLFFILGVMLAENVIAAASEHIHVET